MEIKVQVTGQKQKIATNLLSVVEGTREFISLLLSLQRVSIKMFSAAMTMFSFTALIR